MLDKEKFKELKKRTNGDSPEKPKSAYIQVAESDLLDWHPAERAVIKEIAFMTVIDPEFEGPEWSPFRGNYAGWCFASQGTIALRCGCSDKTVRDAVRDASNEGVLETREYIDRFGCHKEYRILASKLRPRQFDENKSVVGRKKNASKKRRTSYQPPDTVTQTTGRDVRCATDTISGPTDTITKAPEVVSGKDVDFDVDSSVSLPVLEHVHSVLMPEKELKSQNQSQNLKGSGLGAFTSERPQAASQTQRPDKTQRETPTSKPAPRRERMLTFDDYCEECYQLKDNHLPDCKAQRIAYHA